MFEYLDDVDDTTLTFVVYEAGLLLYERERHRYAAPDLPALRGSSPDPHGRITRLVHRVLRDIERVEGMHFTELPPQLYSKYIFLLGDISDTRTRSRPGFDPERGQRLLEELRRDYYPSAA
ncbi:MAG: hypothetical protein JO306_08120 [Gemmatimonadetes bacterium]|nr:hypothetical protein [Gemmatimonadota bacterium]